jgi:hypothetical protein
MNFLYVLYDCADLIRAKKEIRLFFVNFFEAVLQSERMSRKQLERNRERIFMRNFTLPTKKQERLIIGFVF